MSLPLAAIWAVLGAAPLLTLEEAQQLADATSPTAGIARARLDKAEAARSGAWSALFPSLTAAGTYTRRGTAMTRLVDGVPVEQSQDSLRGDLSVDLALFDARALAALSASRSNLDAAALEAEETRRGVSFSVSAAYFGVLSAESLIGAATKRREAAETTVAEARSRFEAGLAAKNDLTRTELELAIARQEEASAKAARDRARLSLGAWIGMNVLGDRALSEPAQLPLPTLELQTLEERALKERADLKALAARAEQLDTLADEPLYRIAPTLGVRGSLVFTSESSLSTPPVDGVLAATLTWRVFDGGTRYADRAQRLADLREMLLRIDEAKIRIGRELREALVGLGESKSTLELAEARAKIAAQNAEEVRTLFASGLAGALEQVDAAVAEFEANASASRQKVSVRVAELSLLAALGAWPGQRSAP